MLFEFGDTGGTAALLGIALTTLGESDKQMIHLLEVSSCGSALYMAAAAALIESIVPPLGNAASMAGFFLLHAATI